MGGGIDDLDAHPRMRVGCHLGEEIEGVLQAHGLEADDAGGGGADPGVF